MANKLSTISSGISIPTGSTPRNRSLSVLADAYSVDHLPHKSADQEVRVIVALTFLTPIIAIVVGLL